MAPFLRINENKEELFHFLASDLEKCRGTENLIVETAKDDVLYNRHFNTDNLAPSNHEEADMRIFFHVKNAAKTRHKEISIRTVDTDVVVIAVFLFRELNIDKLRIEFGTGKKKRWLPIQMLPNWKKMYARGYVFGMRSQGAILFRHSAVEEQLGCLEVIPWCYRNLCQVGILINVPVL